MQSLDAQSRGFRFRCRCRDEKSALRSAQLLDVRVVFLLSSGIIVFPAMSREHETMCVRNPLLYSPGSDLLRRFRSRSLMGLFGRHAVGRIRQPRWRGPVCHSSTGSLGCGDIGSHHRSGAVTKDCTLRSDQPPFRHSRGRRDALSISKLIVMFLSSCNRLSCRRVPRGDKAAGP